MKKVFIAVILTLAVLQVFGQIDSIEEQILSHDNSKSVIISRGRSLLLDRFLENDMDKVKEIKNYMIEKGEDENYIALFTIEYWLILYWTNEYEELSHSIITYDSTKIASFNTRIRPPQDMLYSRLHLKSIENAEAITNQIQNSDVDIEMKNFLLLNFEFLIMENDSSQESLNIQAENFLNTFPETEYEDFINKYIKVRYVPKNWRGALELFVANGYNMLTGELKNDYTNNRLSIGGSIDVCYKRFELNLRVNKAGCKTKRDFDYSTGVYEKGSRMQIYLGEASLGFAAVNRGRFKLAPFAGVGSVSIEVPSNDETKKIPELKELSKSALYYNVGATIDIKLGKLRYHLNPTPSGGAIRIRYGYSMPQFSKKYDGMSGNVHQISIGYVAFLTALKRE